MATTWTDMLKRGCDIAWVLRVEGIPTLFTERSLRRSDSASAVSFPTGYTAVCPALLIGDSDSVAVELDRKTGIARGDSWDITLAWNALEDAGILDDLFARPTVGSNLAAIPDGGSDSVLEYNGTTIVVDDTTGLSNGQTVWLGKEAITIGAVDGDGVSLTGCTRGVAGYAYEFDSQSFGNYRQVTNRPALWRGRFVELHAHLVSREGRIIERTWLGGTYQKCVWRGYLDSPPVPDQHGMRLRALPLCRLAGNDLGFEVKADIVNSLSLPSDATFNNAELASLLIMAGGNGSEMILLSLLYDDAGGGGSTDNSLVVVAPAVASAMASGPHSLAAWVMLVEEAWSAALIAAGVATIVTVNIHSTGELFLSVLLDGDITVTAAHITPSPAAYWMAQGQFVAMSTTSGFVHIAVPILAEAPNNSWLPVRAVSGAGIQDVTLPTSGLGVIEGTEGEEMIRWSEKDTSLTATLGITLLRIVERQINGTPRVSYSGGGKLSVLSGHVGTVASVVRTVLESSGTTSRGTYDTLESGQGLGIPEAWIDLASIAGSWQVASYPIAAVSSGRSSLGDMVGGWLALSGLNLAQVIGSDGECKLAVVGTQVIASATSTTITAADILLESVGAPQVVDAPNEVKIDASGLGKGASITVRDVPRIQSEGPRSWDMKAPSIESAPAINRAKLLIATGDGQTVVSLTVGAWVEVQPGDVVSLTAAHPAMFDWNAGRRAPATVYGRCVGWELDLATAKQRITLLLSGGSVDTSYLAPSVNVASTALAGGILTFTVAAGGTVWFEVGDVITIYDPGDESSVHGSGTIGAIDAGANTITLTGGAPSGVVPSADNVITHAPWATATTSQKMFMYVRPEKSWGI